MTLQPLSDTLVVTFDPQEQMGPPPADGRSRVQRGIALMIGPGHRSDTRTANRMSVGVGDTVYFAENAGAILHDADGDKLLIAESEVLAVLHAEVSTEVPLWVPKPPRKSEG